MCEVSSVASIPHRRKSVLPSAAPELDKPPNSTRHDTHRNSRRTNARLHPTAQILQNQGGRPVCLVCPPPRPRPQTAPAPMPKGPPPLRPEQSMRKGDSRGTLVSRPGQLPAPGTAWLSNSLLFAPATAIPYTKGCDGGQLPRRSPPPPKKKRPCTPTVTHTRPAPKSCEGQHHKAQKGARHTQPKISYIMSRLKNDQNQSCLSGEKGTGTDRKSILAEQAEGGVVHPWTEHNPPRKEDELHRTKINR